MRATRLPGTHAALRLICFDLDGVLYSSEPFLGEAYREAIALVNAPAGILRARARTCARSSTTSAGRCR